MPARANWRATGEDGGSLALGAPAESSAVHAIRVSTSAVRSAARRSRGPATVAMDVLLA